MTMTDGAVSVLDGNTLVVGRRNGDVETFAGYPRELTEYPVEYPTTCSPQAWATAAPLLLMRVLFGLEARDDGIEQNPVLPARITELALRGLHGPAGTYDAVAEAAVHATG